MHLAMQLRTGDSTAHQRHRMKKCPPDAPGRGTPTRWENPMHHHDGPPDGDMRPRQVDRHPGADLPPAFNDVRRAGGGCRSPIPAPMRPGFGFGSGGGFCDYDPRPDGSFPPGGRVLAGRRPNASGPATTGTAGASPPTHDPATPVLTADIWRSPRFGPPAVMERVGRFQYVWSEAQAFGVAAGYLRVLLYPGNGRPRSSRTIQNSLVPKQSPPARGRTGWKTFAT